MPVTSPVHACFSRRSRLCVLALATTLAQGCGDTAYEPVRLEFRLESSHLACGAGVVSGQLGFYVSGLRFVDAYGTTTPVSLDATSTQSQADGVALVGWAGSCEQAPDAVAASMANPAVTGRVAGAMHQAVEFELGVPFEHNHANPLTAQPPLNLSSMFWTWQTGYKFLRLDLGNDWSFHLGSTGCVSASAVRPPQACNRPNLATVRLPGAAAFQGVVVVDLDSLLAGLDVATAENCVEAYGKREECRRLLAGLGIDADTGHCDGDCGRQVFFRYEPPPP